MSMLTRAIGAFFFVAACATHASSLEEAVNDNAPKISPEVTLDVVQDIFGANLDNAQGTKKIFLLAIGMDHTTPGSPHLDQEIGIPYIVHRGPTYWVSKLTAQEHELDVLVNNALLLLFSKHPIPGGEEAAAALLRQASDAGYWPADYFVADYNITNQLSRSVSEMSAMAAGISDPTLKSLALDTMQKFNRCAEMGFAPCQYRVGFWLSSAESSMKDGIEVLMYAIKTTLADKRYQGILNGSVIEAAKEVVMKGDLVGIDKVVRKEYLTLMQDQIRLLQRGEGMTADVAEATEQFIEPMMDFLKTSEYQ